MHELSLCRAIADTVGDHAGGRRVERVSLRVGAFRQVVPDTLKFCWTGVVADTELDGSELVVDYVEARIVCRECGASTVLSQPVFVCGACSGRTVDLATGEEFLVESIDLAAEQPPDSDSKEQVS